jgi:hypothetical protein
MWLNAYSIDISLWSAPFADRPIAMRKSLPTFDVQVNENGAPRGAPFCLSRIGRSERIRTSGP